MNLKKIILSLTAALAINGCAGTDIETPYDWPTNSDLYRINKPDYIEICNRKNKRENIYLPTPSIDSSNITTTTDPIEEYLNEFFSNSRYQE